MRRLLLVIAAVLALAALVIVGLVQAGSDSDDEPEARPRSFPLASALRELAGAPEPLAGLHEQANQLLDGGNRAFQRRLAELEGYPVVINKWASWCGPCRAEFPIFQRVATERGREIGFVGLNSGDKRPAAEDFLADFPVPYPSYEDPDEEIARAIEAPANYPMTVFVGRDGNTAFIKPGGYASAADLEADIRRYLA